jgi:hypothetical protein
MGNTLAPYHLLIIAKKNTLVSSALIFPFTYFLQASFSYFMTLFVRPRR